MTNCNIDLGLKGRFKLIAVKPDGRERVLADWFDNLILDAGLNRAGTGGIIDRLSVGSGNTAPAVGQTTLVSHVATTSVLTVAPTDGYDSVGNAYVFRRVRYRFAAGTATGNLAEVGAGWPTGLFSRALIKDGNGDPTTVTVLADESLDVLYELRLYVPADVSGTVSISGVDYSYLIRPSQINDNIYFNSLWSIGRLFGDGVTYGSTPYGYSPGSLGTILEPQGGTYVSSGLTTMVGSYVNNSYERVHRATFGLAEGNAPFGIMVLPTNLGGYKVAFSPSIPKDNTKVLTLDFKVTWSRRP